MVYKTLCNFNDEDENSRREAKAISHQLEFLAQTTKSRPYFIKDDGGNKLIKDIIASSPKQYIVTQYERTDTFPIQPKGNIPISKKAKGISKTYAKRYLTYHDFYDVVKNRSESRKVELASLKRSSFRIFLIRTRKKLLSRYNSKRFFSDKYQTRKSYFSFPLNFRVQRLVT